MERMKRLEQMRPTDRVEPSRSLKGSCRPTIHAGASNAKAFNDCALNVHACYDPRMNEEEPVRAWREVLARHATTACALERELSERHRLGMSEFEVLERMVEGGRGKYRVQEIADAVHL